MGKFIVFIVLAAIILGLFLYFKPSQTKEAFKDTKDSIGSLITNYLDSREVNLGQPTIPCSDDEVCNLNLEKCNGICRCINGSCYKNVLDNST